MHSCMHAYSGLRNLSTIQDVNLERMTEKTDTHTFVHARVHVYILKMSLLQVFETYDTYIYIYIYTHTHAFVYACILRSSKPWHRPRCEFGRNGSENRRFHRCLPTFLSLYAEF